jgi:hypothetical protein
MFASNTELGIMEQAYMRLKAQSECAMIQPVSSRADDDVQIQISNHHKHQ